MEARRYENYEEEIYEKRCGACIGGSTDSRLRFYRIEKYPDVSITALEEQHFRQ